MYVLNSCCMCSRGLSTAGPGCGDSAAANPFGYEDLVLASSADLGGVCGSDLFYVRVRASCATN